MKHHFFQGVILEASDGEIDVGRGAFGSFKLVNPDFAGFRVGLRDDGVGVMPFAIRELQNIADCSTTHPHRMSTFVLIQCEISYGNLGNEKSAVGRFHGVKFTIFQNGN